MSRCDRFSLETCWRRLFRSRCIGHKRVIYYTVKESGKVNFNTSDKPKAIKATLLLSAVFLLRQIDVKAFRRAGGHDGLMRAAVKYLLAMPRKQTWSA
ncbi:MAG: hypothetical protein A2136_11260 [Chloroflexi bacterium RBG_16_54_11]|nr:MAG: hypothetical protein A2136_11260 [Chloroflexi bacterium RBG_16_54_11]